MTPIPDAAGVLVAPHSELVAMQLRLITGDDDREDPDPLLGRALALCIDADIALVALLTAAHPQEPADVIIARYRRRWKGMFIRWGVVGPLMLVGLLLLVVVLVTLVTAFIWRT